MSDPNQALPPGSVIGVLGGGQLGRMSAMAAARLGYRCHVFAPEAAPPAAEVAAFHTRAAYEDDAALERFAAEVDVVTLEFENIPVACLQTLRNAVPVRPGPEVLAITQDRLLEKQHLERHGLAVADFTAVGSHLELEASWRQFGQRAVLKTRRFGYDGKGQWMLGPESRLDEIWQALGGRPAIIEARIDFEREISVLVARSPEGHAVAYPPVENRHHQHILKQTLAPAAIPAVLAEQAREAALMIARSLAFEGLLAVEMFVAGDRLLINELAPRPHNSGHWTIEGCSPSQFEAHVRAVCNLPLIEPAMLCREVIMDNLLGDEVARWHDFLEEPHTFLHLYGKAEVLPGRKMGHVTRLRA